MDVIDIIREYLEKNGYDGLYNSDLECGCEVDDLAPCDNVGHDCAAGYKYPCVCGDHDYDVGPEEERDRVLLGKRVRIKEGAVVGQDTRFYDWDKPDGVFTVKQLIDNRIKLTAPGYGEPDNYGNGCLYVYGGDVALEEEGDNQ
jgi:hypothetical protein